MRILLFFLAALVVLVSTVYFLRIIKYSEPVVASPSVITTSPTPVELTVAKEKKTLFVPYWSFTKKSALLSGYDRYVYFGVAANKTGLDTFDQGYKNVAEFESLVPKAAEKYLTIRMINSEINFSVLRDKKSQQTIIQESIDFARDHSFTGVMLDLETASLSFDSVINRISNFVQDFNTIARNSDLKFTVSLYGDVFYRSRPYDVSVIGKNSDEIFIMAYDFHKARGNPGPNFPLDGREKYGYDFKKMIEEYIQAVPVEKLTVIFGMYGYDWVVNSKNQSLKNGVPLSLNEIKQGCSKNECVLTQDALSSETNITHIDSVSQKHEIWYESLDSVQKKEEFLKQKGVVSTALWAYSYF